jgi:hypothetical protein
MKKSVGIGVLLLLLLIGGFFLLKKTPSTVVSPEQKVAVTPQVSQMNKEETIQGSIKSLIAGGKAVKCSFSKTTNEVTIAGTVYAGNGKVREDYSSTAAKTAVEGHMIVDGKTGYMWNDAMKDQGFKFDMTAPQPTSGASKKSQTPDINQDINFSCQGWNVDNAVFALPAGVTFSSLTVPAAVTSGDANNPVQGSGSTSCSVCNNIPAGAGRDSCKAQLHCQ